MEVELKEQNGNSIHKYVFSFILASAWLNVEDMMNMDTVFLQNDLFRKYWMCSFRKELKSHDVSYANWLLRCKRSEKLIEIKFNTIQYYDDIEHNNVYMEIYYELLQKMKGNHIHSSQNDIEDMGNYLKINCLSTNNNSSGSIDKCQNCEGCTDHQGDFTYFPACKQVCTPLHRCSNDTNIHLKYSDENFVSN